MRLYFLHFYRNNPDSNFDACFLLCYNSTNFTNYFRRILKMDGIIFDVDGTLWDSTEVVARSWNQAINENSDLPADLTAAKIKSLFGKTMNEITAAPFLLRGRSQPPWRSLLCIRKPAARHRARNPLSRCAGSFPGTVREI